MDGHQIDNIAWFAPVGCRRCPVCSQVHGVQDVTKKFIPLRGEKPKRAIVNPCQTHSFAKTFHFGFPLASGNRFPGEFKSGFGQGLLIGSRGGLKPPFRVLKDVDIRGKARTFAVQGDTASYVAVRATFRRQHAQYMRLQFSEGHRRVFRCAPPSAAHPSRHAFAELS
jgi:hypothetical protein